MAVGIYGNKKLADVDFNDVDIFVAYSPNRESLGDTQFVPLFGSITNNEFRKMLGADGGYKLRLPASVFNKLGFYMVLIKPKSFDTTIIDCSYVITNTDQELQISKKGIVIPKLQFQSTGSLIGYQIEYFDDNGNKIKNFHRIVTSSDLVSVSSNSSSSNPSATSYFLNSNGTQLFLTLTPDEISLITSEQKPDLGKGGQKIIVSNTFFDPIMMEVEMVDQTIKTLSYGIFGNAVRDFSNGVFSIFDENNNMYKQYNLLTTKSQFNNANLDIKEERTNINLTQNFFNISQGLS
jgi:hypothetical protein